MIEERIELDGKKLGLWPLTMVRALLLPLPPSVDPVRRISGSEQTCSLPQCSACFAQGSLVLRINQR